MYFPVFYSFYFTLILVKSCQKDFMSLLREADSESALPYRQNKEDMLEIPPKIFIWQPVYCVFRLNGSF